MDGSTAPGGTDFPDGKGRKMKKVVGLVCLLCLVFGVGIFNARPASADAGFVINEGILQKYTGNADKVVIPGNVTIIGSAAFDENDMITEVVMPANLREIQGSAFQGCDNLKKVTMNDKLTKIGQMSFRNCTKLESVVIPESVNFIGSAAFQYCNSLKSVKIPQKVTTIEYGAFSGCSSLTEITVNESNEKYEARDGVLFDTYESMLVSFPAGRKDASYTVPDGTYAVERQAFWEATNLTEITLPDTLRTLNIRSFAHCKMISEIHIPASVTKIDDGAFEECRALRGVYVMNDWVSFGADVFKGSPGVELYGGIGSAAEEYAGLMRIAFHVVDTESSDGANEEGSGDKKDSEKKAASEEDEKTESSGGDLTRWILFFGIVLAACLVLLFGILMVRRIGRKGTDDVPEGHDRNLYMPPEWESGVPREQDRTTAFGERRVSDPGTRSSGDQDGTWVLGQDNLYDQQDGRTDRNGTQVLGQDDLYDQQDGRTDRNGTQILGKYSINDQQDGRFDRNRTRAFGRYGDMSYGPDEMAGREKTTAYGGQGTVNREPRTGSAYGNQEIVRRGQSAKTDSGALSGCTCRVCGTVNDLSQEYCMRCGAALPGTGRTCLPQSGSDLSPGRPSGTERTLYSSPNETEFIVCPECGMKIRKGGKFCTNCGTLLQKDLHRSINRNLDL